MRQVPGVTPCNAAPYGKPLHGCSAVFQCLPHCGITNIIILLPVPAATARTVFGRYHRHTTSKAK